MIRTVLGIFVGLILHSAVLAETQPHLRLDLPTTLEELETRYKSAREHITPKKDVLKRARVMHQSTIASALHPRADDWFRKGRADASALREACATGDQAACADLAHLYVDETGTMPDEPLAYALSIMGCDAGNDAACELFADRNWSYYLTEHEPFFPAMDHFHASCAEGNAAHCLRLGRMWSGQHAHRDIPEDDEKGQAFFRFACDLGEESACDLIRAPELSPADIFARNLALCDENQASGCYSAGRALLVGRGTGKDAPAGLTLVEKACRLGRGCAYVAELFEQGREFPVDIAQAVAFRTMACEHGDSRSCDLVADAYLTGGGVEVDNHRAAQFREKSCAIKACPEDSFAKALEDLQGPKALSHIPQRHHAEAPGVIVRCADNHADACARLGVLLRRAQNDHARPVFRQACEMGAAGACIEAGRLTPGAAGLAQYQRACDMGTLRGCTWVAEMDRAIAQEDRLSMLKDLCAEGEGRACEIIGQLHSGLAYSGISVPKDRDAAQRFYARSCDLEHLDGCTGLARMFDPGNFRPGNRPRMMALLAETCANGGASACDMLGGEYLYSEHVKRDIDLAYHFYRRACQILTESDTCEHADRIHLAIERRELRKTLGDFEAALAPRLQDFRPYFHAPARRMRAACADRDQAQCLKLADLYQNYDALTHGARDDDQARAIYLHLCDGGQSEACYRYGFSFENRVHHSRHDISADYYQRACDLGYGEACTSLGFFYELGDDAVGPENDDMAGKYHLKACALGNARGCDHLSGLFEVSRETKSAFDLIACLGGDGQACSFIADDYRKGRGIVPRDKILAQALYAYGCSFGDEDACYHHRRFGGN